MDLRALRGAPPLVAACLMLACGPTVNDDHCLFQMGDRACGAGHACFAIVQGGTVPGSVDGCVTEQDASTFDPSVYIHLEHGLPPRTEAQGDLEGSDSIQGAMARVLVDRGLSWACSVDEGVPQQIMQLDGVRTIIDARARLDRERRSTRPDPDLVELDLVEAHAIAALNEGIAQWVSACEEPDPEPGSDDPDDGDDGDPGPACATDQDCTDPAAPLCTTEGRCADCSAFGDPDAACAAAFPQAPACFDGLCVECTDSSAEHCDGETPVCDLEVHECVECIRSEQCGAAGCNLFTRECLPLDAVAHVGQGQEFGSIAFAMANHQGRDEVTVLLHDEAHTESVVLPPGKTVVLGAAQGTAVHWSSDDGPHVLIGDTTLMIENLRMSGSAIEPAIDAVASRVWVDQSQIVDNPVGISAVAGSELRVQGSTVGTVGGTGHDAVVLSDSTAAITYSTLVGGAVFGDSLLCTGSSSATVRNSIVLTVSGNAIECDTLAVAHTITTNTELDPSNLVLGPLDSSWFVDTAAGDFHLAAEVPFSDIALRLAHDPLVDLDGDLRPSVAGSPDYPGADVPVQ